MMLLTVTECAWSVHAAARSIKKLAQEHGAVISVVSRPEALIRYIDKMGRRPLAAIGIVGMLVGLMRRPQFEGLQLKARPVMTWWPVMTWCSAAGQLRLIVLGSLLRGFGVSVGVTARALSPCVVHARHPTFVESIGISFYSIISCARRTQLRISWCFSWSWKTLSRTSILCISFSQSHTSFVYICDCHSSDFTLLVMLNEQLCADYHTNRSKLR